MEELASPNDDPEAQATSAPTLVAQALDAALNGPSASSTVGAQAPVNDLTGMVKKKKKAPAAAANGAAPAAGKRKAEDEAASPTEKKAKLEGEPDAAPAS